MRAAPPLVLAATLLLPLVACDKKPSDDLLAPPEGYDPVETEGLTLNKAGMNALLPTEGDARAAHLEGLKAEGAFKGQAKCTGGSSTGDMEDSQYGEYKLTCDAGTVLYDIELKYYLYTTKALGRPLKGGAYVDFSGTLVDFEFIDESKPRKMTATVSVGESIERLTK
ncbi:hypothetical protein G6O69_25260 [Pseudenhygromyxa sp. WMMC2535]|uniref:hypothetical protein n=1 Tax=Pseudenhygromyxa sp. WMMC2535 TaxID=2712867 RepID=UPI00155210BA|nr:hypothetical protein [Pseudenhygromyxa sp. WMMC2535]NVB41173.1 hypothetical protein [Pseudenhygromyxa sp. WMMC2535]